MSKPKPIQVIPTPEMSAKIEALAERLRTSRAGFVELALEFFAPRIENGEVAVVNGRVEFVRPKIKAA
jgi:hypothetical protein